MRTIYYFGEATAKPIVAQSEQRFQERLGEDTIPPCPHCQYIGVSRVEMPAFCDRRTALRCGRCDAFRGWKQQQGKRTASPQKQKALHASFGGAR